MKHIFWLTLRAARHPYLTMNAAIEAAAARHPTLTRHRLERLLAQPSRLVPERRHPPDGAGAQAMATLIHKSLDAGGIAPPDVRVQTARLPVATRGAPYSARLVGAAGIAPYRWSLLERAPAGLHLEADGLVHGTPRAAAGAYTFNVRVTDATGTSSTRRLTLRVRR